MTVLQRLGVFLLLLFTNPGLRAQDERLLTPDQLRTDLRFIQDSIAATHPEPGFSADEAQLRQAYQQLATQLQQPMTRDAAWRLLATLNPVYADAHLAITQPDPYGQSAAHLKAGGTFFPYEMVADAAGTLRIRAELGGDTSPLAGAQVEQINGVPASRIVAQMLERVHGDTPAFRADLLSTRWPFFYWKMFGGGAQYRLLLADGRQLRVPAADTMPAWLQGRNSATKQFHFEQLAGGAALLTINTFAWPDKRQFNEFTEDAFRRMRDSGVNKLIIDVRANGGGNDDMWIDGVLPYLADQPYRWASTYRKKVIKGRESASEKLGDIIDGEIGNWQQPQPDNPLRFQGRTYVLVGRNTYSSAILFANVMQDFHFGKLVGAASHVRARQSGGTQNFKLPYSGLELGVPRLIFQRPSGIASPVLLQPDIVLPDDPFTPQALVEAVQAL